MDSRSFSSGPRPIATNPGGPFDSITFMVDELTKATSILLTMGIRLAGKLYVKRSYRFPHCMTQKKEGEYNQPNQSRPLTGKKRLKKAPFRIYYMQKRAFNAC
jgi:hypothetical protein